MKPPYTITKKGNVKTSKYRNIKTIADGIKFDSKKEANRYGELKLLQLAGEISDLRLQVPYLLHVNGSIICKYIADFQYIEKDKLVIEDTKGMITDVFRIKQKLMRAVHGVEIKIS